MEKAELNEKYSEFVCVVDSFIMFKASTDRPHIYSRIESHTHAHTPTYTSFRKNTKIVKSEKSKLKLVRVKKIEQKIKNNIKWLLYS